jgi:hypothetical protein
VALFAELLRDCLGDTPPGSLTSWEAALDGDLQLFFEASLPAPKGYRGFLRDHRARRILIPYVREAAEKYVLGGRSLEGSTKADALLLAPDTGFAMLFEAKVLSDISTSVHFDVLRNQIGRSLDVMLEPAAENGQLSSRDPGLTCYVLITPEIFRTNRSSRLYGWLMRDYQCHPEALALALPHRKGADFAALARRIGWLTWEDCKRVCPDACCWLPSEPP